MAAKSAYVLAAYCLFYILLNIECSIVKPNNIPRIGRSDESAGPYDQDLMGYVIKTNKNIPRMGRRNYDSQNRYDIPKFYQLAGENLDSYRDEQTPSFNQGQEEPFYVERFENMRKK